MALKLCLLLFLLPSVLCTDYYTPFPLEKCYDLFYVCFGTKNSINSFGNNYGCIRENNCDIMIQGQIFEDDIFRGVIWYLTISHPVLNSFRAKFSVSSDPQPFNAVKGYIQARFSRIMDHLSYKNEVVHEDQDGQEQVIDCQETLTHTACFDVPYQEQTKLYKDKTIIVFPLANYKIFHRYNSTHFNPDIHLILNRTYIHLYMMSTSEKKASFERPILLFSRKLKNNTDNHPFTEPECQSCKPDFNETFPHPQTIKPFTGFWKDTTIATQQITDNEPEPESTSKSGKPEKGLKAKWIILIALVSIAFVVISIAICYHLLDRRRRKLRGMERIKQIKNKK